MNALDVQNLKSKNRAYKATFFFIVRQAIEKLEKGKVNPTIYSLLEIAQALEVPLRKLVDF